MYELTVRDSFAAAHRLRGHASKCRHLHGHTWQVEVTVGGTDLDLNGMLLDFGHLKSPLERILKHLDHSYLNEHPAFCDENGGNSPTAENIARHIFNEMKTALAPYRSAVRLTAVTVWESPRAGVRYTGGA